jgi:hypothetical protein
MTNKYRLFPPAIGNGGNTVIGGVAYVATIGTALDVPSLAVANQLMANGWTCVAMHGADTTANRPTNPQRGVPFFDTTLGLTIVHEGANWRNAANNQIV